MQNSSDAITPVDAGGPNQTGPRADTMPPLGRGTKLAFSFGAVGSGVKTAAFEFFLLIFYSQVIGLDARLVGLAIMISMIFDAISDPIVGYWSDNLRSRWGRRHPFMYAAILPVSAGFYFLWNPPHDASQTMLFWYVLTLAVTVRTAVTFYQTPNSAMIPELTQEYDARTSLYSLRYLFGWVGPNSLNVFMFLAIFPLFVTDTITDGRFNRDAYEVFGIIGTCIMIVAFLTSSLGTHSRIPHLKSPPPARVITLKVVFNDLFETLSNRSFISLFIAALISAVASGVASGMSLYFFAYFWGFSDQQTAAIFMGTFVAAAIGFLLAPYVSKTIGKKRGAIVVGLFAFVGAPLPIFLRLIDVLPPNDTAFIFWFITITNIVDVGLIICFQILFSSMLADLVEESELKTGRRSEGVFTSAETFIKKSVQGFGVMAATMVLTLAGFPAGATVDEVGPDVLGRMGAYYVPTVLVLWLSMIAVISTYRIDRETHEANLQKLGANP